MSPTLFEERVRASLDKSVVAFNEGRPEFFDEFADDAMIFTVDGGEPIRGREVYRQRYLAALTGQQREKTVLDRNLQIVGDKAVVTQTARITQGKVTADVLQTIVYGSTDDAVKVLHLHTAPLRPQATRETVAPPPVRVVNERIAAVASVLGVAQ